MSVWRSCSFLASFPSHFNNNSHSNKKIIHSLASSSYCSLPELLVFAVVTECGRKTVHTLWQAAEARLERQGGAGEGRGGDLVCGWRQRSRGYLAPAWNTTTPTSPATPTPRHSTTPASPRRSLHYTRNTPFLTVRSKSNREICIVEPSSLTHLLNNSRNRKWYKISQSYKVYLDLFRNSRMHSEQQI